MNKFKVRVRLANGSFTTVTVEAQSPAYARQIVESQYGSGSFLGFL